MPITLTLTQDEANAMAGLLDLAVKSGGINAAGPALAIFQKLKAAVEQKPLENLEGGE